MTPGDPQLSLEFTQNTSYPVIFSEDVFDPENPALAKALDRLDENRVHRAMVFIDSALEDLNPLICQQIGAYFDAYCDDIELAEEPRIIPGGEIIKNDLNLVGPLICAMLDAHLCRHSYVIVVGGGSVIDSVGLAASLVHRGIRVVRIPTTLFAQVNAGICPKYGINFGGRKNSVGTFAPPFAVINDWQLLYTLSDLDWRGGLAEIFRLALLFDADFFDELCTLAPTLNQRRSEDVQHIIEQAASIMVEQQSQRNDPAELLPGHALDFGLWASQRLEMTSGNLISHGEAKTVSLLLDALYSVEQGWLPESDFHRLITALGQIGAPLWFDQLGTVGEDGNPDIFYGIPDFQEHKGGLLCIPFLKGVGQPHIEHVVDLEVLERALFRLRDEAAAVQAEHADPALQEL